MSLRDDVGSSLRWSFVLRFSGQLIVWAVTIFVVRKLSPNDYGLLAMAMVFIGIVTFLKSLGLETALVQSKSLDDVGIRKCLGLLLWLNLLLFVLCLLAAPFIAHFFEQPELTNIIRVLSVSIPFGAIETIGDSMLRRRMNFRRLSFIFASTRVSAALLILYLAYSGQGVWALVIGILVGDIVRGIVLFSATGRFYLPNFSAKGISDLLKFGMKVFATQGVWSIYVRTDSIIIGKILGSEALGIFDVGKFVAQIPISKTGQILKSISLSSFSRTQSNMAELKYYFIRSIEATSFFIFPACIGISAVSYDFVLVVLGEKWIGAHYVLMLLAIGSCFNALEVLLHSALDSIGLPQKCLINVCIVLAIIAPALYLGTYWGINGVAAAWVIAYPFATILNFWRNLRFLGCSSIEVVRAVSGPALAVAVMFAGVTAWLAFLPAGTEPQWRLATSVAVGALIYLAFALTLNRKTTLTAIDLLRPKRAVPKGQD